MKSIVGALIWIMGGASLAVGGGGAEPAQRPNILLILIDDLGWKDLGCQGNPNLETPNVDRLAKQGMRFTDAYAAAPVCSPTRASILTGQAPARLRITNHLPHQDRFTPADSTLLPAEMRDHLPLEPVTLAERLRDDGDYATAFIGKWHLYKGKEAQYGPLAQGFDINIGGCAYGGPPTFFDPYGIDFLEDRRPGEYLPERLADETIAFMEEARSGSRPFFVALWNYTVHWPMEAPADLLAKYEERPLEGYRDYRYAAMIEAMDAATGRVMAALDRLEIAEQTLVIFTSDNGPFGGVGDASPLRADKGHLYEGGIRVPMLVRWPGRVAAGSVCSTPVISTDLFPTLLETAGLEANPETPLDGESLLPLLEGKGGLQRAGLYWHYPNFAFHRSNRLGSAVRMGDYKLLEFFEDGALELYHLREDIGEQMNLAERMPAMTLRLRDRLHAWRQQVDAALPRPR